MPGRNPNLIKVEENLFSLTPEQEEMSKMMYDGKIIKCLVAPYHTYEDLEKIVPFTKTTYVFPEREMTINQCKALISMIVSSPLKTEFRIITVNQNIIIDMIDGCVRVLTQKGDVLPSPCKTFMANIHDIRYELLENEAHQKTEEEETLSKKKINELITKIRDKKKRTPAEWEKIREEVDLIGEAVIRNILRNELP